MEKISNHPGIVDICRRDHESVDKLAVLIHSEMNLHAKAGLVPFMHLMYVSVSLFLPALRRRGRGDDGALHDGPFGKAQSFRSQMVVSSRTNLVPEVDVDKAPHRFYVVEDYFRCWVAEVEPAQEKVDSEHPLQPNRWTTSFGLGIEGSDERAEILPGTTASISERNFSRRVGFLYLSKVWASARVFCRSISSCTP